MLTCWCSRPQIDYKAIISNNTGEDWTGATLSLSTVSPNQSTTIPTLTAPELGFLSPPVPPPPAPRGGAGGPMLYAAAAPMAMMRKAKASVVQLEDEADGFGAREVHVEGGAGRVGMVMRIDSPVDIASDGEEHRVSCVSLPALARRAQMTDQACPCSPVLALQNREDRHARKAHARRRPGQVDVRFHPRASPTPSQWSRGTLER